MTTNNVVPRKHHLDRRADQIANVVGYDDDLMNTSAVAEWLGISTQWLEIGRCKKYGPKFVKLGTNLIRYRRGDVRAWLKERTRASTSEYRRKKTKQAAVAAA
jgi:predicted DNA-binding transcriptional regulator AlpA